jgi:integrase
MPKPIEIKKRSTRGGGSLFERPLGSGKWSIQYYAPQYDPASGKTKARRMREYCSLPKKQAQLLLNDRVGKLARGEQFDAGKPCTVAELYHALHTFTANNAKPGSRSVAALEWQWAHLAPFFGHMRVNAVNTQHVEQYKQQRRREGSKPSTCNRELACLRRMFNYGMKQCTPPLTRSAPHIAMLPEANVRKGFVEDAQFDRLASEAAKDGLWLRLFIELAFTYGWRRGELLGLRVRHVDLVHRTIRLDVGSTKNGEGREVACTARVYELLREACAGKSPNDAVFTRDGRAVSEFRQTWRNLCVRAGVGRWECSRRCGAVPKREKCPCGGARKYVGLIPHDFRRSAAKALRRAGVPESVIMATGGWKTPAMFRRYAIVSSADQKDAMRMLEEARHRNSLNFSLKQAEDGAQEGGTIQ